MHKILHVLLDDEEARPIRLGEGLRLDTHGVQHVIIQLARERMTKASLFSERPDMPLLETSRRSYTRSEKLPCERCGKPVSPQGKWKHDIKCARDHAAVTPPPVPVTSDLVRHPMVQTNERKSCRFCHKPYHVKSVARHENICPKKGARK